MDFLEQFLQPHLQRVVLSSGVELAEEMAAGRQSVVGKGQGCHAEVLVVRLQVSY